MRCAPKGSILLWFFMICAALSMEQALFGHGGRFTRPMAKAATDDDSTDGQSSQAAVTKVLTFPGSGPQVPFQEENWEFWWDYNGDSLISLKPTLLSLTPQAGFIDYPYEKVPEQKRNKMAVFFAKILMSADKAEVREAAVMSLARFRDPNSIAHLRIVYEADPNLYVRTMAVVAMGISRIPAAVDILQSIFENKNEYTEIRVFAAVAAGLAGGDEANEFFKKWLDERSFKKLYYRRLQEAVAFGAGLTENDRLAPQVRNALHNNFSEDRVTNAYLILSLGRLHDRQANAILIKYLSDRATQIRRSAAIALGAAATPSDKDVVEALIDKARSDSDNMVRKFSYIALGKIGGELAEKFLIDELDRVKLTHLPFVGLAIGLTRNPAHGAKVFAKYRDTKNISFKAALAVSLGLLDFKGALGEFRRVVDSGGDPVFVGYHVLALGLLKDAESVERIKKAYREATDVELHRFSAIALGLIGDRSIAAEMVSMLGSSSPDLTRVSTAYNLGLIGDQKAIEPLQKLALSNSENSRLRSFAILGLGLIGDESPEPVISKVTQDNNYTILDNYMYELFNIN